MPTPEQATAAARRLRERLTERGCFGCIHHTNPKHSCPHATGRGKCEHHEPEACEECKGAGMLEGETECPDCDGTGRTDCTEV